MTRPVSPPRLKGASLTVGTRGSALALTQTRWVVGELRRLRPDVPITIRVISTHGDATQAVGTPLSSFGEKGIFARELEAALLDGEIDFATHSMKDLAHTLPEGLAIAATPPREDSRDALVGATLDCLARGARVGTGSVRRRALLLSRRPDLDIREIRGNVDTRLRKLQNGEYDAICLAVAGLNRLGLSEQIAQVLDPEWFTPDPCQGALALEAREEDHHVRDLLAEINDETTALTTGIERAFLRAVGGSCKTPVGARALADSDSVQLSAMIAAPGGGVIWRASHAQPRTEPLGALVERVVTDIEAHRNAIGAD